MSQNHLFVIMGVSGTGKTTIGQLLAEKLHISFYDGDDFHSAANIAKMSSGQPLNDNDRYGWLVALNNLLKSKSQVGAVLACSALKEAYRAILSKGLENLHFIFLDGKHDEIKSRLENRKGHYMSSALLQSQLDTLEIPKDAIKVNIESSPNEIIKEVLEQIQS